MENIHLFTDSCSDLGGDIRAKYNIDYLKMNTNEDGVLSPADLDFPTYTPHEMYEKMRGGKRILTTQVPQEEFRLRFTEAVKAGESVVYIGCALPLSSSVSTGTVVARQIAAEYPDAEIYCVNAINSCLGEGLLTVYAAKLRDEGKSAAEIVAAVEEKKCYVNQYVTVGSLDMLRKAGRVKGSAAFFGNLLGVKPIIISDANGQNVPIKKVKGRRASLDELVNLTLSTAEEERDVAFVGHADCAEDADYLREKLIAAGYREVYVNYIGPIIGACIGPDAIGVFTFGKKVEYAI